MAANQARISRRGTAAAEGGVARIRAGSKRGTAAADYGKQFAAAILEAIALFCGAGSGQGRFQGLGSRGPGPPGCLGSSRLVPKHGEGKTGVAKNSRPLFARKATPLPPPTSTPATPL